MTRCWDLLPKELEVESEIVISPNCQPIFNPNQLASYAPCLSISSIDSLDIDILHTNIRDALKLDSTLAKVILSSRTTYKSCWSLDEDRLVYLEDQIFVPNYNNLQLQILKTYHNYPLVDYSSQTKHPNSFNADIHSL